MSPAAARAAQRASAAPVPAPRRAKVAPVREVEPRSGRLGQILHGLPSGSALGRVAPIAAVALFACVFGVVVFQTLLVQGQARLDGLAGRGADQEVRSLQLRQELADLNAPGRIVQVARDKLGMIAPSEVGYLVASPSDDARAAWSPASAAAPVAVAPKSPPTTSTPTPAVTTPAAPTAATPTSAVPKSPPTTAAAKKTTP